MIRIAAAIAALVFAGLLYLTWQATTGPEAMVTPTNGVIGGAADPLPGNEAARATLAERSRLQDFRGESGPSPEGGRGEMVTGTPLSGGRAEQDPAGLVADWRANREADWPVLRDRPDVRGISPTLPDPRAATLIQAEGRDWRRLRNEEITYAGGWIIFGVAFLLALFLLARGRIPLEKGYSGKMIERFGGFERMNHWMTATAFVMLALTGLALLYGQYLIKPWLGAAAYSTLAQASLVAHLAFTTVFTLGILAMIVVWTGRNIPSATDWRWLARGGGFLSNRGPNPPAEKFNAGQKLIFWTVTIGGIVMIATGVALMFPFFWFGMDGMQWMLTIHAVAGLILMGVIIGHIYIGTVGMEGAIDAMWSGKVDRNWAEEHHSLWVEEEIDATRTRREPAVTRRGGAPRPSPAE